MNKRVSFSASVIGIVLLLAFTSCEQKKNVCDSAPDVSSIKAHITFENLVDDVMAIQTREQAKQFLDEHAFIANYFFERATYKEDSTVVNRLYNIATNPSIQDTVFQEVNDAFGDYSDLISSFEKAFQYYKYYYPETPTPKVQVMLSGLQRDLFVSDSLIVVGVDYFLGPEATYRPIGVPDYIARRYQKEFIVPMTMLLLTQKQNATDYSDKSLLADMVFYGKSYYLAKRTVPCQPDSLLIGYKASEMEDIHENEHIIWANFLENDMLYETSHFMKNKFIGERPNTYEIGAKCPGRIGIWVGWRIVEQYMRENPDVTVQELMKDTEVQKIFKLSGYKPTGN